MVNEQLITYLEQLSRLELDAAEKQQFKKELQTIIDYMSCLSAVDTSGYETPPQPPAVNGWREDIVTKDYTPELILRNAAKQQDGYIVVAKTVE